MLRWLDLKPMTQEIDEVFKANKKESIPQIMFNIQETYTMIIGSFSSRLRRWMDPIERCRWTSSLVHTICMDGASIQMLELIGHLQCQLICLRDALAFAVNQSKISPSTSYPLFLFISKLNHVKIIHNNKIVSCKFDFLLQEIQTLVCMFSCHYFVN